MDSKLLWGILDVLILDVLSHGRSYGYEIVQKVMGQSQGYFELTEGSLYPALHRLERRKLLAGSWQETAAGRRRKYYRLTAAGQKHLEAKRKEWMQFVAGVNGVLGAHYGLA